MLLPVWALIRGVMGRCVQTCPPSPGLTIAWELQVAKLSASVEAKNMFLKASDRQKVSEINSVVFFP